MRRPQHREGPTSTVLVAAGGLVAPLANAQHGLSRAGDTQVHQPQPDTDWFYVVKA